jgi:hypothetical protein
MMAYRPSLDDYLSPDPNPDWKPGPNPGEWVYENPDGSGGKYQYNADGTVSSCIYARIDTGVNDRQPKKVSRRRISVLPIPQYCPKCGRNLVDHNTHARRCRKCNLYIDLGTKKRWTGTQQALLIAVGVIVVAALIALALL